MACLLVTGLDLFLSIFLVPRINLWKSQMIKLPKKEMNFLTLKNHTKFLSQYQNLDLSTTQINRTQKRSKNGCLKDQNFPNFSSGFSPIFLGFSSITQPRSKNQTGPPKPTCKSKAHVNKHQIKNTNTGLYLDRMRENLSY